MECPFEIAHKVLTHFVCSCGSFHGSTVLNITAIESFCEYMRQNKRYYYYYYYYYYCCCHYYCCHYYYY